MKIAFIVNQFPALSETFILHQITGLLDRGHEVDIYAYRPRNDPVIHAAVEEYNLLKRTSYMASYISVPKNKLYRLIKGVGCIAINLPKNPMAVLNSLNFLRFGKAAASLNLLYQIIPFLNRGPYDIVHCHFGPMGRLAIVLKSVGAIQEKIVTTFYGADISSYVQRNGTDVYDSLFDQGDLFLCISEQMKSALLKLGCEEHKIIVHRIGVHVNKEKHSLNKPRADQKLRLLTIARLVEKKGLQYAIQSVAQLLQKYPIIEYKIAGDGPLKSSLQSLIEKLKASNNIKLLGWQRQDRITELLQESDMLLAPSVTSQSGDCEGTPAAIMEALARGLPVLSTLHSGILEVVQEGESGFLVPEGDVGALTEKLKYLIEHSELWPEMGRKGRNYVKEHYDINTLNDRLVEIYQGLLDGIVVNA
jgi:colanic acid/amylovoran biosynthesis glycosyltransferase